VDRMWRWREMSRLPPRKVPCRREEGTWVDGHVKLPQLQMRCSGGSVEGRSVVGRVVVRRVVQTVVVSP